MIRPARGAIRETSKRPSTLQSKTFPAPRRGVVLSENYANMPPESALVLENWFPTTTGIRVRGGQRLAATLQGQPVTCMWEYVGAYSRKRFAADQTCIYDITSVSNSSTPITATVSGRTKGYYSTPQVTTVGGNFQYCFNGGDKPLLYNGTTFTAIDAASTPFITGVTTTKLSHGWVYANRLFMVEVGTMTAWYLPVDSIGGAVSPVSLQGIFKRGGSLMFGAQWSIDAGDGLGSKCVFISTEGDVAIFDGIDPSDPAKWSLQGVYQITKPIGFKGVMDAGGDLLIATQEGIVALSQAIRKDPAALSLSAITRNIEPEWRKETASRQVLPFEIIKIPLKGMAIVSLPPSFGERDDICFVVNIQTGAWAKFVGWKILCMAVYGDIGYYGTNAGTIHEMEASGSDNGSPYTCTYVGAFDHLDSPAITKSVTLGRAIFRASTPVSPRVSCSKNYNILLPSAPSSPKDYSLNVWDSAKWDVAKWDSQGLLPQTFTDKWFGIGVTGYSIAPQVQVTYGITLPPIVELVTFDILYENGGIVV